MSDKCNGLERALRPLDAVMIVVGNVVGVGIFTTTGFIAGDIADAWLIMAVWLLGGALTLLGALSYGELGAAFPRAGGDYVYLREAYGPLAGFLVGWVGFFIINPGSIAALALGLAEYLLPLAAGPAEYPVAKKVVALAVIVLFSALNYFSVRWACRVQNAVSGLGLLTIIVVAAAGFIWGRGDWANFDFHGPSASLADLFGPAMVSVFFTYSGWFVSAYVAGELKEPQKSLPISLIISSLLVMALYVLMNALYIYALPVPGMAGVVDIARQACLALFGGPWAANLVSLMIIVAILGSLNSVVLTAPRIYYAMASDEVFPARLARVHPRFRTPHWAIGAQTVLSCLLVLVGNFYQLLSYTVFFMLLTSTATALGVFVLRRRKPDLTRPYKVWGYPYTTLAFVAAYAWIAARIFWHNPWDAAMGLLITLSGVPFYLWWSRRDVESQETAMGLEAERGQESRP
ncbi:amino acid permease-associated region [Desulfarculus baarsii DSM 2075]|uniref:Amino acid permease-associated region n=1 Tax=Desulfarculus baarsii (strain ATCC 33931 / DSM 2075 / LMG 7858 / VKM B-1802 / 2st14) TaxID=644282 RepID=E1QHG3_DESB2|nr:amino acid permease [Desulfarculus baarsii]ADK85006.1 amino acid permease-associated region [Desulfarculus baarsii DSM 2075]